MLMTVLGRPGLTRKMPRLLSAAHSPPPKPPSLPERRRLHDGRRLHDRGRAPGAGSVLPPAVRGHLSTAAAAATAPGATAVVEERAALILSAASRSSLSPWVRSASSSFQSRPPAPGHPSRRPLSTASSALASPLSPPLSPPINVFTEDEEVVRDAARRWAGDVLAPVAREMDEEAEMREDIVEGLFEEGLMGMVRDAGRPGERLVAFR